MFIIIFFFHEPKNINKHRNFKASLLWFYLGRSFCLDSLALAFVISPTGHGLCDDVIQAWTAEWMSWSDRTACPPKVLSWDILELCEPSKNGRCRSGRTKSTRKRYRNSGLTEYSETHETKFLNSILLTSSKQWSYFKRPRIKWTISSSHSTALLLRRNTSQSCPTDRYTDNNTDESHIHTHGAK